MAKLTDLATKAPQALQKESRGFLAMCKSGDEQYSESEMQFYGSQVEELNRSLETRGQQRAERASELSGQLEEKRRNPLNSFIMAYKEAEQILCASKGYGRKYGEPRRKAQERCRTLIACAATVRELIQGLLDYFSALCELSPPELDRGGFGMLELPAAASKSPIKLSDFFKKAGEPWTFSGELIGVFSALVLVLNVLGSHLGAFRQEFTGRYALQSAPRIRVLKDGETMMPQEGQEAAVAQARAAEAASRAAEAAAASASAADPEAVAESAKARELASLQVEKVLREDCLLKVLGSLMQSPTFTTEIQAIVKSSHEAYAGQKEGTPDFMQRFLQEMQQSSEQARLEASHGLRAWGDELREAAMMNLSDVLFGEATSRAVVELRKAAEEAQQATVPQWANSDALRANHEQRLNPGLSNPNAEAELEALVEAEKQRFQSAVAMAAQDRARMAFALRTVADNFVRRISSIAEQAVLLVDLLPLHGHYNTLPGDEQLEPPRMSIKRRMRRLQADDQAATVVDTETALPERKWQGIPRYQLRGCLIGNGWPADPVLEQDGKADEGKLAELTTTLSSFRSPVHRRLFERRTHYYEAFQAEFSAEVGRRAAERLARETKEQAGDRNWQSMVRQLLRGAKS